MDFSTRPRPRRGPGDVALLAFAGALFLGAAWNAMSARAERDRVQAAAAEARDALAAAQARLRGLGSRPAESDRLATRLEMTGEAGPLRILAELTPLLPQGARLRSASFDYGDGVAVGLDVETRSALDWDELLERLSRATRFENVRPGPEKRADGMRTSLRLDWREIP
jgi:hypothetical protein